jgi:hypothetical protein
METITNNSKTTEPRKLSDTDNQSNEPKTTGQDKAAPHIDRNHKQAAQFL